MTLRFAIRRMPTASTIVTTAGNPSGMAETAAATANSRISVAGMPRYRPTVTSRTHTLNTTTIIVLPRRAMPFWRGVGSGTTCLMASAILPISVCIPVWVTTAVARPYVTVVPICSMFFRSATATSPASVSVCLSTGMDSPVKSDSFTARLEAFNRRASAGTLSPASIARMSPGTISSAGTWATSSLRRTLALGAASFIRASMAASARVS